MACVCQGAPRGSVEHSSGCKVGLTEDVHAEFLHTRPVSYSVWSRSRFADHERSGDYLLQSQIWSKRTG